MRFWKRISAVLLWIGSVGFLIAVAGEKMFAWDTVWSGLAFLAMVVGIVIDMTVCNAERTGRVTDLLRGLTAFCGLVILLALWLSIHGQIPLYWLANVDHSRPSLMGWAGIAFAIFLLVWATFYPFFFSVKQR